jgi:hypothetical protein
LLAQSSALITRSVMTTLKLSHYAFLTGFRRPLIMEWIRKLRRDAYLK